MYGGDLTKLIKIVLQKKFEEKSCYQSPRESDLWTWNTTILSDGVLMATKKRIGLRVFHLYFPNFSGFRSDTGNLGQTHHLFSEGRYSREAFDCNICDNMSVS